MYGGNLKREKAKNSWSVLGGSLPFTITAAPAVITRAVKPQIRSAHPNPTWKFVSENLTKIWHWIITNLDNQMVNHNRPHDAPH